VPGMVIMAPKDESELRDMLFTAINYKEGPVAIRYPRGNALGVKIKEGFDAIEIGKSEKLESGGDVVLLAVGSMVEYSIKAAKLLAEDGIHSEVINMRYIKPLDTGILDEISVRHNKIVTLEENTLVGGFGSGVLEYFNEKNYKNDILRIGLPDMFINHGTQKELHNLLEIDPEGIAKKVKAFCKNQSIKQKVAV
jgi:1-deoxy-D-xylulose-5-phosphate synthase